VYTANKILPQTATDANGEFDLIGVVAGSYDLYFLGAQVPPRAPAPGVPPVPAIPLMGMVPIDVGNDDVNGVAVTINPGTTINGRVTIDGGSENASDLTRIRINLDADPTGVAMVPSSQGSVTANATFKIENVWPAKYRITAAALPLNTYVKSMRFGNVDLLAQTLPVPLQTDGVVEIVIGTDTGQISGRVEGARGDGISNAKVALVPDAPLRSRLDLYKSITTDPSGEFRLGGIPPGDYKVFAWDDTEDNAWTDPEFLRADEPRGKSIRISAGRSESATVTVLPARR
jgi:hypothetical protein